ncbi:hypothetical protein [Acinetobacter rudis]|uniref:Uncharacterized protein n=1 Tax=Acinetobacter rudis TaxID=632955 RepID=A0AAW8J808_9GAMM|nr:hypothetical protein [Acinetobacter rudis]MDQ8935252.1 hypothetical protein [Acinetobacter rudis]MDQ8952715.1 hypothetical protein [Acinetobacter rudis]MDQ9017553.1 hypothetical protein [Acinetobacter rudis]
MIYTWNEFEQRLIIYRDTVIDLSRMLSVYENHIKSLIIKIKQLTFEQAVPIFDELYEIQGYLASAQHGYDLQLNHELSLFVYHFDRAYDEYIRQYWYQQFLQNNITWPLPEDK